MSGGRLGNAPEPGVVVCEVERRRTEDELSHQQPVGKDSSPRRVEREVGIGIDSGRSANRVHHQMRREFDHSLHRTDSFTRSVIQLFDIPPPTARGHSPLFTRWAWYPNLMRRRAGAPGRNSFPLLRNLKNTTVLL